MYYQPWPSPGQTSSFIPPTPTPLILQPSSEVISYDHSRYGMVILTILSLTEVVVPHLSAYCPLAAGMLYLYCSFPFLYWALVSRYPEGWTPTMAPWYDTTPSHDIQSPKHWHPSSGIDSQATANKTKAFDYYPPPDAPFGPMHFTEYPHNSNHKPWTLKDLQWYTFPNAPKDPYQIVCDGRRINIYPLILNRKYNNPVTYLIPMEPPLTPKPTISTPPTSDTAGQSSQFLGVLYLAPTGLIDSALSVVRPWAVAGKALSYLVKLGPIIWWAMLVPASTPPSPAGALQYSWYPDTVVGLCWILDGWILL
ncbi:hypothetical protein DSO57_1016206 [Entomophthora muscae]|uniref:Uncharacterized protein n=1 Tax=Entomophthora muscae TaxID=34485 RepID=A0ACC2UPZ6_9FUNG|nr:hypothetical protein DSO57_1016206 [Entomophthora muscae]